ncbi:MAG: hypothetical protein QW303_05275, partial [Nitrososphaerota archaeon]
DNNISIYNCDCYPPCSWEISENFFKELHELRMKLENRITLFNTMNSLYTYTKDKENLSKELEELKGRIMKIKKIINKYETKLPEAIIVVLL